MRYLSFFIDRARADGINITLPKSIGLSGEHGFSTLWNGIYNLVFAFLAVAAFIGIIYSGIMMITAGSDAAKFAAGKKNLVWAIIGIIVLTLAYLIINFTFGLINEVSNQ